jgi:hypothetical protein
LAVSSEGLELVPNPDKRVPNRGETNQLEQRFSIEDQLCDAAGVTLPSPRRARSTISSRCSSTLMSNFPARVLGKIQKSSEPTVLNILESGTGGEASSPDFGGRLALRAVPGSKAPGLVSWAPRAGARFFFLSFLPRVLKFLRERARKPLSFAAHDHRQSPAPPAGSMQRSAASTARRRKRKGQGVLPMCFPDLQCRLLDALKCLRRKRLHERYPLSV